MKRLKEAVKLFKQRYGKTPKELSFELNLPVVGIYEKQHAFLFAVSEEVIKAYKAEQNIIRGWMVFDLWPLAVIMVNYFDAMLRYHDMLHWRCMISYVILAIWIVLFVTSVIKVLKLGKKFKLGQNITFLNY